MKQPATAKLPIIRRLNIPEAIDYLHNVHGVRVTKSTLNYLRVERRGPAYSVILRRVYYSPQDLDRWVTKTVSEFSDSQRRADQPRL